MFIHARSGIAYNYDFESHTHHYFSKQSSAFTNIFMNIYMKLMELLLLCVSLC